jgi:hypothetical protein
MPYRDLLLDRDKIDDFVSQFIEERGYSIDGGIQHLDGKKRVYFGRAGSEFALVDIHFVASGTTTVQWKLGRNQPLGEELAKH